ncbi:MAG: tetratricopeptide repeat protein [Candidatus Puniceispirillales bacterium]
MNDILNEIDQELRQERMKQLWRQYGTYVIAAVAAIVLLVAGRQGLVAYQESARTTAADSYHAALANAGNDALEELAADGGEGYAMLARFSLAAEAAANGDALSAEETYLAIASDTDIGSVYRDAAVILSVMNAGAGADPAALSSRLEPVAAGQGGWSLMAMELQIGLALEQGDVASARQLALTMRENENLPADVNRRLQLIEAALGE